MTMQATSKELTGRKVLAITLGFFGTIIAVNLAMAWFAVQTFPGLEVRNSYIAGQGFNDRLRGQQALNWTVEADLSEGRLSVRILDEHGSAAPVSTLTAILGRPTTEREDTTPDLVFHEGAFVAEVAVDRGNWDLRIRAEAGDGTPFEYRLGLIHL